MKIDKNIKVPKKGSTGKYIDVLRKMEVGDSVLFTYDPIRKSNPQSNCNNFRSTANINGYKVTQRTSEYGIRVWVEESPEINEASDNER